MSAPTDTLTQWFADWSGDVLPDDDSWVIVVPAEDGTDDADGDVA